VTASGNADFRQKSDFWQFWAVLAHFSFLFCSLTTPEKQRLGVTATRIVLARIFDAAIH
jgi:hypothetical protein